MKEKTASETMIKMTELVLPNDTNLLGNLLGGRLMHWMDIAGALAATRHARHVVATVQVDSVDFKHPIRQGEMVEICARLIWVGRTSMVTKVSVCGENLKTGEKLLTNEAYFTFVALDDQEKPIEVPRLKLETDEEESEFLRMAELKQKK